MSKEFRLFDHIDEKVQEGEFIINWDFGHNSFYMYFYDDNNRLKFTFAILKNDYLNYLQDCGFNDFDNVNHEHFIINNTMDCLIMTYYGYDEINKKKVV